MARKSRKNQTMLPLMPEPEIAQIKTWRAALYIRLSVEFNSNRGDSLETQKQIMEAYLALYPEIEVVEIYTDNGVTGQMFARPAFAQMLADIEAGKIDCIVVKDLSRLGRNAIDTGYYIEKYFPLHHVRFIAVNDQYDSEKPDNSPSHIIVPLKNMINEAYAADISKKVHSQARQSIKKGEFIGARPPFGYKKAPDNCHKLLDNEDTAPIVRQIFTWTAEGVPLNVVVKRLNEMGAVTPSHYLAEKGEIKSNTSLFGSGKWQTWTVNRILSSETYVGDMVQGKSKTVGRKQTAAPPEEWVTVRNTHEPLVSRELFSQVQSIRKQVKEMCSQRERRPYTENILRGRIFCGHCGKNLHRQRRHWNGQYFFHCISNDRIEKGSCTGNISIDETELFGIILSIIRQEAEAIVGKNFQLQQEEEKREGQKQAMRKEITKYKQETANNQKFLISLYESYVTGILTRDEYSQMKADYEEKITAGIKRVQCLEEQQKDLETQVSQYSSLAEKLAGIHKDTALTAQFVEQLIERITVNGPKEINIRFRFENAFPGLDEVFQGGADDEKTIIR